MSEFEDPPEEVDVPDLGDLPDSPDGITYQSLMAGRTPDLPALTLPPETLEEVPTYDPSIDEEAIESEAARRGITREEAVERLTPTVAELQEETERRERQEARRARTLEIEQLNVPDLINRLDIVGRVLPSGNVPFNTQADALAYHAESIGMDVDQLTQRLV